MKNTRKLIPALAMLLVSAVMMSTASFAWFTMNSKVEATGMQVTAVAPASLWISQTGADNTWVSAITLATEIVDNQETTDVNEGAPAQFKPVTPVTSAANAAWVFHELTDSASALVLNNGTLPEVEEDEDGNLVGTGVYTDDEGDTYVVVNGEYLLDNEGEKIPAYAVSNSYYKDTFYLQLQSTEDDQAELNVQVMVTDTTNGSTDAIWQALRVAVVAKNEVLTFTFDATADGQETASASALATLSTEQTFTDEIVAGADDTEVVVYAWFEGTDPDCMNANALNADTWKIDLVFTIGEVAPAGN